MEDTVKGTAKSEIKLDGVIFKAGDTLEAPKATIERLIRIGVIEDPAVKEAAEDAAKAETAAAEAKAKAITDEATAEAEKLIADAKAQAEKIIKDAQEAAKKAPETKTTTASK